MYSCWYKCKMCGNKIDVLDYRNRIDNGIKCNKCDYRYIVGVPKKEK